MIRVHHQARAVAPLAPLQQPTSATVVTITNITKNRTDATPPPATITVALTNTTKNRQLPANLQQQIGATMATTKSRHPVIVVTAATIRLLTNHPNHPNVTADRDVATKKRGAAVFVIKIGRGVDMPLGVVGSTRLRGEICKTFLLLGLELDVPDQPVAEMAEMPAAEMTAVRLVGKGKVNAMASTTTKL